MVLRFKDLLLESEEKFQAERLAKHLNSGNWYNDTPMLLRGSEREVKTWAVKKPYESREPMTTDKKVQWLAGIFREKYYPSYPSRNKSRFASVRREFAENYGDVYYVFPHKNATIGSLPDDAYLSYLGPAHKDLGEFYSQMDKLQVSEFDIDEFKSSLPNEVVDFCEVLMEVRGKQNESVLKKVKKSLEKFEGADDVFDIANQIDNDRFYIGRGEKSIASSESIAFSTALRSLADFLHHISDYFTDMEINEINDRSMEVIIQGELIQVNEEFAETYFEKTESGLVYQQK